jgi:hypothetical protein
VLFAGNIIAHTLMCLQKPAIEPAIARFHGFVEHFARKFSGCFLVHHSHCKHGNQGRQASAAKESIQHSTRSSSIALRLRCCTPGLAHQRPSPPSTRSPRSIAVFNVYCFALLISPLSALVSFSAVTPGVRDPTRCLNCVCGFADGGSGGC